MLKLKHFLVLAIDGREQKKNHKLIQLDQIRRQRKNKLVRTEIETSKNDGTVEIQKKNMLYEKPHKTDTMMIEQTNSLKICFFFSLLEFFKSVGTLKTAKQTHQKRKSSKIFHSTKTVHWLLATENRVFFLPFYSSKRM